MAGRESLKDHVTFAINKGIAITEGHHDGAARMASQPAPRPRTTQALAGGEGAATLEGAGRVSYAFSVAGMSTFLALGSSASTLCCHTNGGQRSQGSAYLSPPIRQGQAATLRIFCRNKAGRMRYFVGCAPHPFSPDAGQAVIQRSSYSLENLKAAPNQPGRPCMASAPPCFHTGSVVTMRVNLTTSPGNISWEVDTTGVRHRVVLAVPEAELHMFVSLYNREACFQVLQQ